jgi:hypothetical protein
MDKQMGGENHHKINGSNFEPFIFIKLIGWRWEQNSLLRLRRSGLLPTVRMREEHTLVLPS